MYIYLASSWRNEYHSQVLMALRQRGYAVYDFKNPVPDDYGFSWFQIDKDFRSWTVADYRNALKTEIAGKHYDQDKAAMDKADTCVLLLPSGRSAHLEAGYMAAQGKHVYTLIMTPTTEPELMTLLLGPPEFICTNLEELFQCLQ